MKRRSKGNLWAGLIVLGLLLVIGLAMTNPVLLVVPVVVVVLAVWYWRRSSRKQRYALLWAGNVDAMTGTQFEDMLGVVFGMLGYRVEHTGQTGDFGADLILQQGSRRVAVQAKRYSSNVGNKAVQEVYASMRHYGASEGWVVTNSDFTSAAREQADSCGIRLLDREALLDLILRARDLDSQRRG